MAEPRQTFSQKWGDDPFTAMGHTQVPNALVEFAARLGLKSEECWLICCILRFKYDASNPTTPQEKLAELFGQSVDTIQRTLRKIEAKKLLKVARVRGDLGRYSHTVYDFTPLRHALNECFYQDHPQDRPQVPARPLKCGVDQAADMRYGAAREPGRISAVRTTPQICGPYKKQQTEETCLKETAAASQPELPMPAASSASAAAELIDRLVGEGMNRSDAVRLAGTDPEECRRQLGFLPYIAEFTSSRGAYLRSAIEQGFAPPKAFLEAERGREEKARLAEAARALDEQRRQEQGEAAALEARKAALRQDPARWQEVVAQAEERLPVLLKGRPGHVAYQPALEARINEIVAGGGAAAPPERAAQGAA